MHYVYYTHPPICNQFPMRSFNCCTVAAAPLMWVPFLLCLGTDTCTKLPFYRDIRLTLLWTTVDLPPQPLLQSILPTQAVRILFLKQSDHAVTMFMFPFCIVKIKQVP